MKKGQSQIVLLATTATASASFIKRAYETNLTTRIATISDLDPGDLVQVVGADAAKGVMLSQSLPEPSSRRLSMVADYNRLIDAAGGKLPRNAPTLEGYIQGRVIVEGLRRASSLAPSTLISTYESFKDLNLGGYTITFTAHSHEGAAFVDTAILSSGGRVVR